MIIRNTGYSSLTVAGKIVAGVGLLIVLARLLPREDFGTFSYALTVATILGFIVDYGFNIKLLRDLTLQRGDMPRVMSRALAAKVLLAAGVFALALPLRYWPSLTSTQYQCLLLLTGAQVVGSFTTVLLNPFKCTNRFQVETVFTGLDSVMTFALSTGAAVASRDVLVIAAACLLARTLALALTIYRYALDYGWIRVSFRELAQEVQVGFPYAVHVFVGNVYLNADTLVLKEYVTLADVGLYQAAMRLVVGAGIALTVVNSVLMPRMTELRGGPWSQFHQEVRHALWVVGAAGILGFLALSVGSSVTVRVVFGARYSQLESFLWIFGVIVFLRFVGSVYGVLLTISDRQGVRASGVAATLAYIVVLDLFVIPKHGVVGAAWVLLSAHVLLTALYLGFVRAEYRHLFLRRMGAAAPPPAFGVPAS